MADHSSTVWDSFSGKPEFIKEVSDFLTEVDDNPRLRSSANSRILSRVWGESERLPERADFGNPVELQLQDVLVLMNQLMAWMR